MVTKECPPIILPPATSLNYTKPPFVFVPFVKLELAFLLTMSMSSFCKLSGWACVLVLPQPTTVRGPSLLSRFSSDRAPPPSLTGSGRQTGRTLLHTQASL